MRARCGCVDARRLPPHFVDRCKAIEQQLPEKDRTLRARHPLAIVERRGDVVQRKRGRVVEFLRAGARFKTHLRQQCALRLPKFRFRRPPVGRGFTDAWIGLHCHPQCVIDRKGRAVCRSPQDANAACEQ